MSSEVMAREVAALRREFREEVQAFLQEAGIPERTSLQIRPDEAGAAPVYLVTGATFTPYDPAIHGGDATHALAAITGAGGERYLMNNTAAVFERLAQSGERIVIHSKNPALVAELAARYGVAGRVRIISGDLDQPEILSKIYGALEEFGGEQPISNIRMALYQSFAQNNGEPFKPLHREPAREVERAAAKRIRFVYNMAALGYDLLVNRGLEDLRIVSLSALASSRATYGLLADAADKFMNELMWRTFHLESNVSTGKPVSIYQVNPGITTACDVYRDPRAEKLVRRESIADGFPMDEEVLEGRKDLPQISSQEVAWVVDALLRTPEGADPNAAMPERVRELLYGGFTPEELESRFAGAVRQAGALIDIDPDRQLPEHILTPQSSYGRLPEKIEKGAYRRVPLSPPGQRF